MNEPTNHRGQSHQASLIQIPVRFVPAVAESIRVMALDRSTSVSIVLRDAVVGIIDETSKSRECRRAMITAAQSSLHGQLCALDVAGDPRWPAGAQRLRAYIPKHLVDQLDDLSAAARLTRTQLIRFAIARFVDGPGTDNGVSSQAPR